MALPHNPSALFDRPRQRLLRARAAPGFARHAALAAAVEAELAERLAPVAREFDAALIVGGPGQGLATALAERGVAQIVVTDTVPGMAGATLVADDEALPFLPASFDLVIGNLNLHRVNDVPGVLGQMVTALKPGGLFLAAFIGGHSLHELRACLLAAEDSVTGGASPRLHPTISISDASALLQRTGLLLPVTDQELLTLTYPDIFALMRDLRGMGETNSLTQRQRSCTRRAIFAEAARLYAERHAQSDGRIPASFDIIFLHGWRS